MISLPVPSVVRGLLRPVIGQQARLRYRSVVRRRRKELQAYIKLTTKSAPKLKPVKQSHPPKPTTPKLKVSAKKLVQGERLSGYLVALCNLRPDSAVLDVGCGGGGPALALTHQLERTGRYEGLDINRSQIDHATAAITSRHKNFRFQLIDVFNQRYNPTGTQTAAEYRFPFEDATFDVVFMNSVFTHMMPKDVANYLRETARVLKPGGRCLITYFLMNDEAERGIADGLGGKSFAHRCDGYWAEDAEVHERAVAYDERWVRELYAASGLRIDEPILYGSWCGREQYLAHQDFVVAVKR